MGAIRLLSSLLAAAALSFAAGFVASDITTSMPCEGEGLACNIDDAVGAYGVIIAAVLGPIIYGVTLFVARNRTALGWALVLLLVPVVGFYLLGESDYWRYVGFDPYKSLRTFLVMTVPPALTVIVQWLILRLAVRPELVDGPPSGKHSDEDGKGESKSEPVPFPTE